MEGFTGTVKSYNIEKGYGFINVDGTEKREAYFHITQVKEKVALQKDEKVQFQLKPTKRVVKPGTSGEVAFNINLIKK